MGRNAGRRRDASGSARAASAAEIQEWVNERVEARYQKLSSVFVLDAFPRNAAGKTLRREIREIYSRERDGS